MAEDIIFELIKDAVRRETDLSAQSTKIAEELKRVKVERKALQVACGVWANTEDAKIYKSKGLTVLESLREIAWEDGKYEEWDDAYILNVFEARKVMVDAGYFPDDKTASRSIYARLAEPNSGFIKTDEKGLYKLPFERSSEIFSN